MKTDIIFQEIQKQNQKWIWFLLIIILGIVLFGFIQQVIFKKPFGTHPVPDWGYSIFFAIPLLGMLLLYRAELYTCITEESISFKYRPFQSKERVIQWEEVDKCYVRLYSPVKEFGGWGKRTALNGKNGSAYNVSGNKGIQLELKSGERILIGTRNPGEASEKIRRIQHTL